MTWEERMAERAKARCAAHDDQYKKQWEAQRERYISDYAAMLTKETAQALIDYANSSQIGCACIGGPACCMIQMEAAKRVLNDFPVGKAN